MIGEGWPIKQRTWTVYIVLPLIVALCFGITYLKEGSRYDAYRDVTAQSGFFDLRGFDFSGQYAYLTGDIEYVPNALLTPQEFDERQDILIGRPSNEAQYYTVRIRLLLPAGEAFTITGDSIDYAERTFVNGIPVVEIGEPGDDAESMTPRTMMYQYTVYSDGQVIEVVRQASNFVHHDGGNPLALCVGRVDEMRTMIARKTDMQVLVMGIYVLLFFVHLILYLLLPSYKANLYFSLFCFAWFFRTGVTSIKVLMREFPKFSWYFNFRIEYMTIPLACILLMLAIDALFPQLYHKAVLYCVLAAQGVFVVLYAVTDTLLMSQSMWVCQALILAAGLYTLIRLFFVFRKPTIEQSIFAAALSLLLCFVAHDVLYYNGILLLPGLNTSLVETGAFIFILFQMVAMLYATIRNMISTHEREQTLAMENAALDRVNRLKSDMMNTVSHEIRTPLAVMMGYAQLTAKEMARTGQDTQLQTNLGTIASEAQRLSRIVEELRGIQVGGGQEDVASQRAPVAEVAEQVARLYRPILQQRNNRMQLTLEQDLPEVACSADALTQVLFNLLHNANRHTRVGNIDIHAARDGKQVALSVIDDGKGISPEFLPRAFEKHKHEDPTGSGMGLAICKEIIEGYGGVIKSRVNRTRAPRYRLYCPLQRSKR